MLRSHRGDDYLWRRGTAEHFAVIHDPVARDDKLPTFLRLYLEAAGEYTVPPLFHFWCAISLLATYGSRGLVYEHIPGNPMRPNLYVFLIAKSAAGKGLAMSEAQRIVRPDLVNVDKDVNAEWPYMFEGRTSAPGLVSRLAWLGRKLDDQPVEFYFISPELGQSLDLPANAIGGFVKMMTGIYDATGREWSDNTRTHGPMKVPAAYINWVAGTTPNWLRTSVGEEDFKGGFAGRIVPVYVDDRMPFKYQPTVPASREKITNYLRAHLQAVRTLVGRFTMTRTAREADESWARARHENLPSDERMHPFYERGATLSRKLAMSFSLARGFDKVITHGDLEFAQRTVVRIEQDLPKVLDLVSETKDTRGLELMRKTIERAGRMSRKAMAGFMRRQMGITRTPFIEFEATLVAEGSVAYDAHRDELVWIKSGTKLRKGE